MIGDDLQVLLGMIPVRDRAGIARSNLQIEAEKSAAAARGDDGNAEGQTLTRQGFDFARAAPPPVSLPPAMGQPEPDAANLPVANGAPAQGFAVPPSPRERVVASSAAAAPSPAVTRYSDIMLDALEKQARQQKMMQIIGSLGMIANSAFNRNPQSQASTKSSLADMIGGGGGGRGGGGDLKTLLDMRAKEDEAATEAARRAQTIPELQRMFGWSPERAAAAYDSGEFKKDLDPGNIAKRDEAQRAGRVRMDLSKPEVIAELAKRNNVPEEVIRADIASGKVTSQDLTNIAKDLATTGKTVADTAATRQATADTAQEIMSYEEAKNNRAKFMERYDLSPSGADRALANRPAFNQFTKDRSGATTAGIQGFEYDRARAREAGKLAEFDAKYPDLPTYERLKVPSPFEDPNAKVGTEGLKTAVVDYIKNEVPAKVKLAESIASNAQAQDLYRDDLITGGGKISKMTEAGLRTAANLFGLSNDRVANTQVFFNHMRGEAIKIRQESMPGAMSNDDRVFLEELGTGNREWSPDTVRRFLIVQEKYAAAQLWKKNQETIRRKKANPEAYKGADIIPMPAPNRFLRQALQSPQGQEALNNLRADPSPRNKIVFDEMFGKGRSDYFLEGGE